ncbi:MAG: glucose-1-phosphate adenylyltransferase subunit GlgD [Longicatena sp.]
MCDAFGIVNYEGLNVHIKGMLEFRPVSAFSFLGRYRLIDFPISNLSNSGVNQIKVFVKSNPRSLLEHLGTGRHYNINSKRGKLHILPAKNTDENDLYNNDINSYLYNMQAIEGMNQPYVILTPSHMVYRQDYSVLLDSHIASGADVTMLYHNVDNAKDTFINCDTLELNKQKGVLAIEKNRGNFKSRAISLETYILSKELFIELIKKAANISSLYWFRDILNDQCGELDIRGIAHRGFIACINDFKSYFDANMDLLNYDNATDIFTNDWPIYTRTNDSCPTQYYPDVNIQNSRISNGCLVEGDIYNSVIGRGAVIKKGAVIKNSVILPGALIGEDVHVENVVVDKQAKITRKKEIVGLSDHPLYVKRNDKI